MSVLVPCNRLRPYVKRFVVRESATPECYTVLPDTSIVLGFQYKGRLSLLKKDRDKVELAIAGITGLGKEFRAFVNAQDTGTVLAYFTETGAAQFFDFSMHELFGGSYPLQDIYPHADVSNVGERLAGAPGDLERVAVVEEFLLAKLNGRKEDLLISSAIDFLKAKDGDVRIKKLAEQFCISQSRFEKRFRNVVGTSPKSFSSIIRFQKAVCELSTSTTLTDVAHRAGYFDQAHFAKDFRSFSGQTPEQFLRTHAGQRK